MVRTFRFTHKRALRAAAPERVLLCLLALAVTRHLHRKCAATRAATATRKLVRMVSMISTPSVARMEKGSVSQYSISDRVLYFTGYHYNRTISRINIQQCLYREEIYNESEEPQLFKAIGLHPVTIEELLDLCRRPRRQKRRPASATMTRQEHRPDL